MALVIQTIVGTLLTLFQVKILSNYLDPATFGLFASLQGFVLLIGLLAANGLPQVLVRFLPVHEAIGDSRRAIRLSQLSLVVTGLLVAGLGAIAYVSRGRLFAFAGEGNIDTGLMTWMAVTTTAVALRHVIYGGLQGLRRMGLQMLLELATLLVTVVWMFSVRGSLSVTTVFKILGVVHTGSVVVGIPLFMWLAARTSDRSAAPEIPTSSGYGSRRYLWWAVALSIVGIAFTDVDRFLIAYVLPLEVLALFHVAARITRTINRLLAATNTAFQPEVTRLLSGERHEEVPSVARLFLKLNVAIGVLAALCLGCFTRDVILLTTSVDYLGAAPLLVLLAVSIPVTTATAPLTTVMRASDQIHQVIRIDVGWAVVYLGLILTLSPPFGLIGAGTAYLVACLSQLALAMRWTVLPVGPRFVIDLFVRIISAAVIALLPLFAVMTFARSTDLWLLAVRLILFLLGALVTLRLLIPLGVFEAGERDYLVSLLRAAGVGWLARVIR